MTRENHFADDSNIPRILLITVSSTRTAENDESGKVAQKITREMGFHSGRTLIKDSEKEIFKTLFRFFDEYDCFVYMGGTGPGHLDVTTVSLRKIADKELPGFGELFRKRSNSTMAYLSDASFFIYGRKLIFCLPGSPDAQKTGIPLILEILRHALHEANKD